MHSTTVVLPYPVSANAYWRSFVPKGHMRPVTTLSEDARKYKAEVAKLCMLACVRKITGPVEIAYTLYPKRPQDWAKRAQRDPNGWQRTVLSIDLDNASKVLLDALKGIAFGDDRDIERIVSERAIPDGEARVVVIIRPHSGAIVQPALALGIVPSDPLAA